ncbi:DEAD/DEAH box helicase [Cytobacillus horneckiae]|uniref:SNF2 helicase associated domain-containing protein n=1 Tax=Cytobacillus horneckiae TaxID=549687 RepID=UPI0034CFE3C7
MNNQLSQKNIIERCGAVSYKRGEAFYRGNKVLIHKTNDHKYVGKVKAAEAFSVTVDIDENGSLFTECSCPKLASFNKDCQHIAAVLIALGEVKPSREGQTQGMAEDLIAIFSTDSERLSTEQAHFENRELLNPTFICKVIPVDGKQYLGISLAFKNSDVLDAASFIQAVRSNKAYTITHQIKYSPELHCFRESVDTIFQFLADGDYEGEGKSILLSPSIWKNVYPILLKIKDVHFIYVDKQYDRLIVKNEVPPLSFSFYKKTDSAAVTISGLHSSVLFDMYDMVFIDGVFYLLSLKDFQRLTEIKTMIEKSHADEIVIEEKQIGFFLEKVVPGLRKLGHVHISKEMTMQYVASPLKAKLYLDRVNHRILASLEFHYGNIVINPVEGSHVHKDVMVFRDIDKEETILELMGTASFTTTDEGYYLHNEELEYEFLYHLLPKLQKLVKVYATTAIRNRIYRENPKPKINVRMKKERTNWLEFKFDVTGISEQEIRNVLASLEEKRKYHRLKDGTLFSLESREFAEIQAFLKRVPVQDDSWIDFPFLKGMQTISQSNEEILYFEKSFREFMLQFKQPGYKSFPLPTGMQTLLRTYQKEGYYWMKLMAQYGFGGVLADDMGLGKTIQAIAFILSSMDEIRRNEQPALIICPSSVTYNWLSEFRRFAPSVKAVIVDGKQVERATIQKEAKVADVLITSYPLLRKDITWYEKQFFHTIIFDEAQSFKNPVTETAKAVKKLQSNHRFALTGTPIENSIEELWSIFHVVFPELFLGLKEYSQLSRQKIARMVQPFMLRRVKAEVLSELPEKIETLEAVELLPEQKKLYAAYLSKLRHDTLKHLNKQTLRKNRIRILAGLTRLRQICCHPKLFVDGYNGNSAKFEQLLSILREAKQSGRRVLVFSQFTKMLEIIGRELANEGREYFYLDGQTPTYERVKICNQFNEGEKDLFLISLKAGGTGLNLTGADTVILYDLWWNPAVEEQAADRAYRMGQTKDVHVIKMITRGTIEEKIEELQDKKKHLIEEILDKQTQSTLTEEDILDILELRS